MDPTGQNEVVANAFENEAWRDAVVFYLLMKSPQPPLGGKDIETYSLSLIRYNEQRLFAEQLIAELRNYQPRTVLANTP